jgi:hypothetical protein
MTNGLTVERPTGLFARGSIMKSAWQDRASPIAYGFEDKTLPVYFNQDPVFNVTAGGAGGFGGGGATVLTLLFG